MKITVDVTQSKDRGKKLAKQIKDEIDALDPHLTKDIPNHLKLTKTQFKSFVDSPTANLMLDDPYPLDKYFEKHRLFYSDNYIMDVEVV